MVAWRAKDLPTRIPISNGRLRGKDPERREARNLPVQQPTKIDMVINLKAAKPLEAIVPRQLPNSAGECTPSPSCMAFCLPAELGKCDDKAVGPVRRKLWSASSRNLIGGVGGSRLGRIKNTKGGRADMVKYYGQRSSCQSPGTLRRRNFVISIAEAMVTRPTWAQEPQGTVHLGWLSRG
jgi:hypothetical protein